MKAPPLPQTPPLQLGNFTLDVQYYVQQEYLDISQAAVELPTVIEWLNYQHQIHIEARLRCEAELEKAEAQAYFRLKDGGFQNQGYGDKATEAALKYAIDLDEEVQRLKEDVAVYRGWCERLTNLAKSLQFKLDLVRSSEATRRKLVE